MGGGSKNTAGNTCTPHDPLQPMCTALLSLISSPWSKSHTCHRAPPALARAWGSQSHTWGRGYWCYQERKRVKGSSVWGSAWDNDAPLLAPFVHWDTFESELVSLFCLFVGHWHKRRGERRREWMRVHELRWMELWRSRSRRE